MGHVFGRVCGSDLPRVVGGEGCYLIDSGGRRYLDGSGGAAVSCLGHGDESVTSAIKEQLDRVAFGHSSFFTSSVAEDLADLLVSSSGCGLERVYFVSGGSEAVESSLKLARQYFVERGELSRHYVIGRRQSYHGNTLGALSVGGNEWRRRIFSDLLIEASHISPCYEYRDCLRGESSFDYGIRVAGELEAEILRLGSDRVMAFIAEPVVGATLGAVCATSGYFRYIREICDKYGILLILDEVMCGMGRTGSLYAYEQEGICPDIVVIAKGLGGGYQPIGAMICSGEIYDTLGGGSGFFQHGHTYMGHPVACSAGLAVLRSILERGLLERVAIMGERLRSELRGAFGEHEHVGDIRGRGLFIGIELVEDRLTKSPFSAAKGLHKLIKRVAFSHGLICYPMGGTVDGVIGDHILLAPPFIIEDSHIDELVVKLERTFSEVF